MQGNFGGGSVTLHSFIGIGNFGTAVAAEVERLLQSLTPWAARAYAFETVARLASAAPIQPHEALTNLERVQDLTRSGLAVRGHDAGRVQVRHIFLVHAGEIDPQQDWQPILDLVARYPGFALPTVVLFLDDRNQLPKAFDGLPADVGRLAVMARQATGAQLNLDQAVTALAGFLLVQSLVAPGWTDEPRAGWVHAVGFAAKVGLDLLLRKRLARLATVELVTAQLADEPVIEEAQKAAAVWEESRRPEVLLRELFAAGPDRNRPPVDWNWLEGDLSDTLTVRLDRATISLQLEESRPEQWVDALRGFSRRFDMTQAVIWKSALERSAAKMQAKREDTVRDLLATAERQVRPFGSFDLMLELAIARHRRPASASPSSIDTLEPALAELASAIQSKVDPAPLFIKSAVWTLPALLAGIVIVPLLYTGMTELLIQGLFTLVLLGIGFGWPLWLIDQDRQRLRAVREHAVDRLVERQEGIVALNALGYLRDVQALLLDKFQQARDALSNWKADLEKRKLGARAGMDQPLSAPMMLEPLLTEPDEIELAYRSLGLPVEDWLGQITAAGLLPAVPPGGSEAGDPIPGLDDWVLGQLDLQQWSGRLSFEKLLELRTQHRGPNTLEELLLEAKRLSRCLHEVAVESAREQWMAPRELQDRVDRALSSGHPGLESVGDPAVPWPGLALLAWIRHGLLPEQFRGQL